MSEAEPSHEKNSSWVSCACAFYSRIYTFIHNGFYLLLWFTYKLYGSIIGNGSNCKIVSCKIKACFCFCICICTGFYFYRTFICIRLIEIRSSGRIGYTVLFIRIFTLEPLSGTDGGAQFEPLFQSVSWPAAIPCHL